MTDSFPQCEVCNKPHDYEKESWGSCMICKRLFMCLECCSNHECLPRKTTNICILTNPKWLLNEENENPK
jgi:hypothetical protein